MVIFPKNYQDFYPCINECGSSSVIYASLDYTKAYKIHRKGFNYDKDKFKYYLAFNHPNCFFPTDTVVIENNPNLVVGYEMNFDDGIALSKISDVNLSSLIAASLDVSGTLKEISNCHFLVVDPNVDNITFSTTFKFVDTYSYLLAMKYAEEVIYKRNIVRINDAVLCGLIGFSYKKVIIDYLSNKNSKDLDLLLSILSDRGTDDYIYNILSIIQDATQEDSLSRVKRKIYGPNRY